MVSSQHGLVHKTTTLHITQKWHSELTTDTPNLALMGSYRAATCTVFLTVIRLTKYTPYLVPMGELWCIFHEYSQTSNISHTLVGNTIADHSDVVGASPASAASTTSSFLTLHLASMDWAKTTAGRDWKYLSFGIWCDLYYRFDSILDCAITLDCITLDFVVCKLVTATSTGSSESSTMGSGMILRGEVCVSEGLVNVSELPRPW